MSASNRIRLVCFDLGGVIVRICRSWDEGCKAAGIPFRPLRDQAPSAERMEARRAYQCGMIDRATFAEKLSATMGGLYSADEIIRVNDVWIFGEYEGVYDVIRAVHDAGVETAILSNTSHEHWVQLCDPSAFPAVNLLRNHHASHRIRCCKPDEDAYRCVERSTGLAGDSILFFDDLAENIEGARACGWNAVQINHDDDPAAQMMAALREHGVPRM